MIANTTDRRVSQQTQKMVKKSGRRFSGSFKSFDSILFAAAMLQLIQTQIQKLKL